MLGGDYMPKQRKPMPIPKQIKSQKPKKQKQQKGTQKTRRVSSGIKQPSIPKIPKVKQPKTAQSSKAKQTTSKITDMETGEVVQDMLPTVNEQPNFYSDVIINSWRGALGQFSNGDAYNFLNNWLNDMIAQNGKDNVAEMLQRGTADGNILTWEVVYKTGEAERYISTMLNYLPDQGELYKEEVQDKFEYYKQMTDAFEQEEDWEEPV